MDKDPQTANDRWKGRWTSQVVWSTVLAALLHAAVFWLLPTWETKEMSPGAKRGAVAPVSLVEVPSGHEAMPTPATPEPPATEETEPEDAPDPEEPSEASRSERPSSPRTRVEPKDIEVHRAVVAAPAAYGVSDVHRTMRRMAGLPEQLTMSEVAVGGLATVAADVAVQSTSGWILIQNPTEIETFLRGMYDRGRIDPSEAGAVSVALQIDEKGSVAEAEITDSSGREGLDEIVLDLFKRIVSFRPARDRGSAVPTSATFSLSFPWF